MTSVTQVDPTPLQPNSCWNKKRTAENQPSFFLSQQPNLDKNENDLWQSLNLSLS